MTYYDEALQTLAARLSRRQKLDREIAILEERLAALEKKALSLRLLRDSEQADVDRLEGRSLSSLFYRIIGKMEKELSREKQEALAAALNCAAAQQELDAVKAELQRLRDERRDLTDCERQYNEMFAAKAEAVRSSGSAAAEEILSLESEDARLSRQSEEIAEAIRAGQRAQHTAQMVLSGLDTADGYATWDLVGGGVLADLMKHSQLDDTQELIGRLTADLRRFKTELADISIQTTLDARTDGFLTFADFFFDGLLADWAVKDRIRQSRTDAEDVLNQIGKALASLNSLQRDTETARGEIKRKIDALILSAPV